MLRVALRKLLLQLVVQLLLLGLLALGLNTLTERFKLLCCLQPQAHMRGWFSTASGHSRGIILLHLYTCKPRQRSQVCRYIVRSMGLPSGHTSFFALALNLLGTLLTLWLAVLLLNSLGTCWKARVDSEALDLPMLVSIALISNSLALTKVDTSRSPFLFRALSEACANMVLAMVVLTRFTTRLGLGP